MGRWIKMNGWVDGWTIERQQIEESWMMGAWVDGWIDG